MGRTDFGKLLAGLRVDRDETMQDMASRLGVSSAFLSVVERGKRKAPPDFADRVAVAYPDANRAALRIAAGMERDDFRAGWNAAMEMVRAAARPATESPADGKVERGPAGQRPDARGAPEGGFGRAGE